MNIWQLPNTWQAPEPVYLERQGGPTPGWPCASCGGAEPVAGRYCFASTGPGAQKLVGCKRTGRVLGLIFPRQASLFEEAG